MLALAVLLPLGMLAQEKPFTIPEVTEWTAGEGTFEPSRQVAVQGKAFGEVARQLVEDAKAMKLGDYKIGRKKGDGAIVIKQVRDKALAAEGYRLTITPKRCLLEARTETGAYWGTRTLLQLLDSKQLACGTINDAPQYRTRGFMLDVGRKYIPMTYLRRLVKVMAYHKMNVLQLHLNDNGFRQYFGNSWERTPAAFRLECNTYPGLTAKDGHYTKAEFIELQKLAEAHHVEIVPEIDSPAHVLAFTHYRPSLGSKTYGMDHFDLSNPEVVPFMEALFKEYLEGKNPVFRGPRVNIGTDEYSNRDQDVVEQFRAYTDHFIKFIKRYGKRPLVWGSLSHAKGTTPVTAEGVDMCMWNGYYAKTTEMKPQGFGLISMPDNWNYIVPAAGYYYDYLNQQWLYKNYTPAKFADVKLPEQDPQVEGAMFALWNDHCGNGISVKDIHHRAMPALDVMATKCWTASKTSLPYSRFVEGEQGVREAPGVNELGRLFAMPALPLELKPQQELNLGAEELGYDYAIELSIDCAKEEKGTVLSESPYGKFYLSDPVDGKLGFERDGYLNQFDYTLPQEGRVVLRIEGTNKETRLYVDGKLRQKMGPVTLLAATERSHWKVAKPNSSTPDVYTTAQPMYYQRTLCFPLAKTGSFKGKVTIKSISQKATLVRK